MNITQAECDVLRRLGARVREIAELPGQQAKRQAIVAHNRLRVSRPLVYCFPEGAWLECIPPASLQCTDPVLRGWETRLRMAIYTHEHFDDDQPIDAVFNVAHDLWFGGWGIDRQVDMPDADRRQTYYLNPYCVLSLSSHPQLGAYHAEPAIQDRRDLDKLVVPQLHVRPEGSERWLSAAREVFEGLLTVRRRHAAWLTVGGLPATAVALRGMESLMMDMYDDPAWVHEFIQFLARAHNAQLDALERGGYLSLNNGAEWIGTGGIGYSDELPAADFDGSHVRCKDIWGGLQSQDLVGISRAMFEEFFFPHMQPIMERFGLSHYGCCEGVHDWLPVLMRVGNLRRISISPWADVRRCAEQMRGNYVFCYKPLPTPLATPRFDEKPLEHQYEQVFRITRDCGCPVEIMIKDLHTVQGEPRRLSRWVQAARRASDRVFG